MIPRLHDTWLDIETGTDTTLQTQIERHSMRFVWQQLVVSCMYSLAAIILGSRLAWSKPRMTGLDRPNTVNAAARCGLLGCPLDSESDHCDPDRARNQHSVIALHAWHPQQSYAKNLFLCSCFDGDSDPRARAHHTEEQSHFSTWHRKNEAFMGDIVCLSLLLARYPLRVSGSFSSCWTSEAPRVSLDELEPRALFVDALVSLSRWLRLEKEGLSSGIISSLNLCIQRDYRMWYVLGAACGAVPLSLLAFARL